MYKKIFGLIVAMLMLATSAFAVDIDFNAIVASSSLPASITYTCVATDGVYLKMTVSGATETDKIHYVKNGIAEVSGDYASAGSSILMTLANTDTLSLISSTTVDFTILTQKTDELSKNESLSASLHSSGSAILCDETNGIVVKVAVSAATATSAIHYKKGELASTSDTSVLAGAFVLVHLRNDEVLSLVASTTTSFTALTIPVTELVATNSVTIQSLVASTVAVVALEPVKLNMVAQTGSPSLFLKYSTSDFATNTVGTNLQGGSTVGFDLASGSLVTMFSNTGITNSVYSFATSVSASQSSNDTQWFGPVANVINFTGTEPVSLQMSGASADCFVLKNASATVLSPTKVPSNGTYTIELFTGDYISFISNHVGSMLLLGRIAGGASAPLVLNSRTLTTTFTSGTARTITFRNKVPKRVMITAASQTAFIEINGTASTTSSILKASPTSPFVKRLMPNDTISTVGTAPIKITIRSVPIGR